MGQLGFVRYLSRSERKLVLFWSVAENPRLILDLWLMVNL